MVSELPVARTDVEGSLDPVKSTVIPIVAEPAGAPSVSLYVSEQKIQPRAVHGWGEEAITAMVNNGKTNVMPPQGGRLTPEQIHVLAAYVWNLSQPRELAAK